MFPFRYGLFIALLVLFSSSHLAIGQTAFANKAELEKAANDLFAKQDYSNAKPLFSQLLSQDALNADYNYRFGVCIMFTEPDPAKPLPYIEGGANSKGVNPEAYYFLGLVYRFNYRFDESAESFVKAKEKGFTSSAINLDRETQISRNGRVLYNDAVVFKPGMEKDVIKSEFYRPYDFRKLKGKVIPTPPNFKSKYDEKAFADAYIYAPTEATALVFASYGETGATGRDLYLVNKLPNGEFALPQRLPDAINTVYDEDFAYLDESSNTLIFSSKGHNTMGGYDVFSSRYDDNTGAWSVPLNLQHPTNSPFDDFLYITDPDNVLAYFTSSRKSAFGMVKVFKTEFSDADQLEMTVIEGRFEDATDNELNYLEVTVTDPETKDVIGSYRSQILSGRYIMILPPKMGYSVDVAPRGAQGFRYVLDVPKREAYQTIRQSISFAKTGSDATVKITNYFDKTGNPDTVATVLSRPLNQVVENMPKVTPQVLATAKAEGQTSKQAEAKAKAEQEKLLAEKKAEEARLQAEAQAKAKAEQEKLLAEKKAEEARLQAEAQAKAKAEQEKLLAEKKAEEARLQAEAQAKAKAEQEKLLAEKKAEEARLQAETQAKAKAEQEKLLAEKKAEEVRLQAEAQAKAKAEQEKLLAEKKAEEARLQAEAQAKAKAEQEKLLAEKKAEEARLQAETQAKAKAEQERLLAEKKAEEARIQAETQTKTKAEQEKLLAEKKAEEARLQAEAQAKAKAEQEKLLAEKKAEEARLQAETQAKAKAEQEKLLAEKKAEEARLQAETQAKAKTEQEKLLAEKKAEEQRLADEKAKAAVLARMDSLKIANRKPVETKPTGNEAEIATTQAQEEQELRIAQQQAQQEEQALKQKEIAAKQEAEAERKRMDSVLNAELAQSKTMAANESKAAEQAKRELEAQDAKLREEQKQAILQLKEDLKKREQQEKDLADAKLQAEAERKANEARLDTLAAAPLIVEQKEELEQAKENAAKAAAQTIAEAKERELAEVQRKAEIETQKEAKAELNRKAEKARVELENTQKSLAKEKAAEQALQAAMVNKERNRLDSLAELEAEQLTTLDKAKNDLNAGSKRDSITSQATAKPAPNDAARDTTQDMSDTELFMQTVAKLEAQRKANEEQVKLKAQQEIAAKAKAKEEQEFARIEAEQKALADAIASGDTVKVKALESAMESARIDAIAAADTTPKPSALKSDADPTKYLADMLEAERKIAADAKKQTVKDYTLKPMPELARQPEPMNRPVAADTTRALQPKTDKALEARIEEDRRIVDQHQELAKQQEEKLREQMQRDRDAIAQNDTELLEELKQAEQKAVTKGKLAVGKSDTARVNTDKAVPPVITEKPAEVAVVAPVVTTPPATPVAPSTPIPTAAPEEKPNVEVAVQEPTKTEPSPVVAVSDTDAAAKSAAEQFRESVAKAEAERKLKDEQAKTLAEATTLTKETAPTVAADTAKKTTPAPITKEVPATPVVDAKPTTSVTPSAPNAATKPETAETRSTSTEKTDRTAALRDYSKRTADFTAIQDKDQRVLVQRMAAEDRGRLAVQKQVNNAALTDARSAEKLEKLQRTQDVLANAAKLNARENATASGNSKDDLRKRKDLEYRIAVKFPELTLSEHVSDALNPEYAASMNLGVPQIIVGRQLTLADARSEVGQLAAQGFAKSTILALLNGAPVSLENARSVPFID